MNGYLALILAALFFGATFLFQRHAASFVGVDLLNLALFFALARSVVAALILGFLFFKEKTKCLKDKNNLWAVLSGIFFFFATCFQQYGISFTTVGKSGFLTGIYVILVPIFSLFFGEKNSKSLWIAVFLAFLGLSCFAEIKGSELLAWNFGDSLTLCCAFFWAWQVIFMGIGVKKISLISFVFIQIITVIILCLIALLIRGEFLALITNFDLFKYSYIDILFAGIFSSCIAFSLQGLGQKTVPSSHTAVIISSEAIFALIFGFLFFKEPISLLMCLGCSLLFTAIIIAQRS